jgi:ABC-type multidrug transport system permease subunit
MKSFLRSLGAFVGRDAAIATSYPAALVMSIFSTIGRVVVMWLPAQLLADSRLYSREGGFLSFSIVGTAMMGVFMASYGGFASAIRSEQAMGTLESLLMSPIRIPTLVLGANLWTLVFAVLDAGLTLGVGAVVFGLSFHSNWLAAAVIVALTNLSFVAVGVLSAAFAVVYKRGDPFRLIVGGASFLLGGVIYPVEVLPRWLEVVAWVLPTTHGIAALRGVLVGGHPLSSFTTELLVLFGFATIGLPCSIAIFKRALVQAKRDGTLLQY